jgi:hypothetical protein
LVAATSSFTRTDSSSANSCGAPALSMSIVRAPRRTSSRVRSKQASCGSPRAQVSDAELSLVVRDAGGIVENDLTVATARLFGWNRRGPDIAPRLSLLIGSLLDQGLLVLTDGELNVGSGTAQFLLGQSRDDPNSDPTPRQFGQCSLGRAQNRGLSTPQWTGPDLFRGGGIRTHDHFVPKQRSRSSYQLKACSAPV